MKHKKSFTTRIISLLLALTMIASFIYWPGSNVVHATSYTTVDTTTKYQTFEGWGTSLGWWANAVGGWTMEGQSGKAKREEIMDLVFGADGLNLNIVRYNIPGGENPDHNHLKDFREMPLVKENSTSIYNWNADANQLWVLQQANAIRQQIAGSGKSDIINEAFSNAPPYWMTTSGCVSGAEFASDENLPAANYQMFAEYIADYVTYLQNDLGIQIDYVEPLNEAGSDYWGANGTQEGMRVYAGESQSKLIMTVYNELVERGLISESSKLQMTGLDETSTDLAVENWNQLDDATKNIISKINTHIYSHSVEAQEELHELAYGSQSNYQNPNYKIWMSEIAYGGGEEPSTTSMKYALELAFDVQENINVMGASAWIYWQIVESSLQNMMYGNNYGLIHGVFQDVGNDEYGIDMDGLAMNRGDYELTKQYYALGQYSRYIKQGYSIVQIENTDTGDVKLYNVAALSPDGTELVIVSTNLGETAEPNNYYLKGFRADSCTKIVTSDDKNWATSTMDVNGNYLSDTLEEGSITTYVLQGEYSEDQSGEGAVYFSNFLTRDAGLYAQYYIADAYASYTLYYATNASDLPCNGGTGAQSVKLETSEGEHVYKDGNVPKADNYFAVIEKDAYGTKTYSRVLEGKPKQSVTDDFVYFTSCGKTDKCSFAGNPAGSFGEYYGLTDQVFDSDPFSGMRWGLYDGDTEEYNSDDIFKACRYANGESIVYKYEVPDGSTAYSLCLGFQDPWQTADRIMDIYINGTYNSTTSNGTKSFTTCCVKNVTGKYDAELGGYFVTIEVRQNETTTQKPAINFIVIQDSSQKAVPLGIEQVPTIALIQGESLTAKLPASVNILNTKGYTTSTKLSFDRIEYADALVLGSGSASVHGTELTTGMNFDINVGLADPTVQVYYYIDFGATKLIDSLLSSFDGIKRANAATLINTDALDKPYVNNDTWGRVGSDYAIHWENDPDKLESVIESSEGIRYWLPGLPAGDYVIEIGVNIHGWNISDRGMNFVIGGVDLGTIENYNDKEVLTYTYTKTDNAPVMFECSSLGGEKPLLAYMIIKKVTKASDTVTVTTPSIPASVASTETTIQVGNLTKGALLVLRDGEGNLLADKVITQQDVNVGTITIRGLDLSKAAKIEALQFMNGKTSNVAVADVPQLIVSAPRDTWSTDADVLVIQASSETGVDGIFYKFGEDGQWVNVKAKKFVRAFENGTYYIKLVTKAGDEVVRQVQVTHVDAIHMTLENDLSKWTNGDVELMIGLQSTNPITNLTALINGKAQDITGSFADGKYYLTVTENCDIEFVAKSDKNGQKRMNVHVKNIDKEGVSLSHKLVTVGGVTYVDMHANSISDVIYSYSFGDGERVVLNEPKVLLHNDGQYIFHAESLVGKTDSFIIDYYSSISSASETKIALSDEANGVVVSVSSGNATLSRLDGSGNALPLTDGKATLQENGKYRIVVQLDDKLEVIDFVVSSFESDHAINGLPTDAPATSSLAWLWYVLGILLMGGAAGLLFFLRKGGREATGGNR